MNCITLPLQSKSPAGDSSAERWVLPEEATEDKSSQVRSRGLDWQRGAARIFRAQKTVPVKAHCCQRARFGEL